MAVAAVELILTGFLAVMIVSELISLKARLPYTLVLVFVGIGITALSTLPLFASNPVTNVLKGVIDQMGAVYTSVVQGGLFVGLVVPPLIFEAMMHIRVPDLRSVIRPSLVLATAGVAISTAVCGVVLWQILGLSLVASLLFAAIISPTDVVTVLEVFRRTNAPTKLATMMNTEAAFNDATAIVIFSIMLSSVGQESIPLLSSVSQFVVTLAGGAAVGFVVSLGAKRVSATIEDNVAETILTVSAVYGSYVFATGLGMSGLIAVAVVGLYFGNVTIGSTVLPAARETITTFWQIAAFLGNSVAFLMIGFVTNLVGIYDALIPILVAYLAVTIARAASAYPILAIFSQVGERIPFAWSNVAMLGGMRGALSIALVASLSSFAVIPASDVHTITSMVLGVAFLSLSIQAPILSRYIRSKFGNHNGELARNQAES